MNIPTIKITLKKEIKSQMKESRVLSLLVLMLDASHSTITNWLNSDSDKLTNYATMLALSEILATPVEELITIERENK